MKKVYTIGRDPQSDIVINDSTDVVSRLHATIRIEGTKMFLIDQSQNGTYVNGMRMSANEEIPVTREDSISFANVAELDWSLLPDPKKAQMKSIGIVIAALFAIIAIVVCVLLFNKEKGKAPSEDSPTPVPTDTTTIINDDTNKVESDSVSSKTVTTPEDATTSTPVEHKKKVVVKVKSEEKPKEEKKEAPKTEIVQPLY